MVGRPRAETELVAHAKRGDLDAFEQLVREHQGIAFRTAYVIAGSAADAEEAVQDAFTRSVFVELDLAQADALGGDLDALVVAQELQRLLERQRPVRARAARARRRSTSGCW